MVQEPKRVFAYRDIGPKLSVPTKWEPRVVECSENEDPVAGQRARYVVKYRRAKSGDSRLRASSAAMCINEMIGSCACALLSVPTAEPAVVYVSEDLARSYDGQFDYSIFEGHHFGSRELSDVLLRQRVTLGELSDPGVLIDLWAMDCWLMNRDRNTYGNILYEPQGTKLRVIAVDHGECFAGAGQLAGGASLAAMAEPSAVSYPVEFFEQILYGAGGVARLRLALSAIKEAANLVAGVLTWVPAQWWEEAGISAEDVEQCLMVRGSKIQEICDLEKWESVESATNGGQQILI